MARTPGAPRSDSNLARVLRTSPNDMQALERVLQDDPSSAVLPLNGKPVLVFAMSRQCSLATLRVLLDYGAQLKQETLDALLAMTVPDAFEGNFQIYKHAQPRSCPVSTRLHVRYAIFLLNLGVRASPHAQVGYGNEACAHCARSYIDATAAAVLRRLTQDADKDFWSIVADFVHF